MSREQNRTTRIEARITPDALAVVKRAAELEGRSISDFVVAAAQEAAHRTIEETHLIRLSVEDQRHFVLQRLVVECLLVLVVQTQATVLAGKADTGESAFMEPLLEFASAQPATLLVAMSRRRVRGIDGRHVLGQPRSRPRPEVIDRFGLSDSVGAIRLGH